MNKKAKIQKCLRLALDNDNRGEADAAIRQALRLLDDVDDDDLGGADDGGMGGLESTLSNIAERLYGDVARAFRKEG